MLLLLASACQCHFCEDPLERERRELREFTDRFDLRPYRAAKLAVRALPTPLLDADPAHTPASGIRHDPKIAADVTQTSAKMLDLMKAYLDAAHAQKIEGLDPLQTAELSAHFVSLLADADEVDEDAYPLLVDQLCVLSQCAPAERPFTASEEHLALAVMIHESKQPLPASWSVYELSRVDIADFREPIYRLALALYRSYLYAGNDWPYLAELDADLYLDTIERVARDDRDALILEDVVPDDQVRFFRVLGHLNRAYIRNLKDDDEGLADDLATCARLAGEMSLEHWALDVLAARGAAVGTDLTTAKDLLQKARDEHNAPALVRGDIEDALEAIEKGKAGKAANALSGRLFYAKLTAGLLWQLASALPLRKMLASTSGGRLALESVDAVLALAQKVSASLSTDNLKKAGSDALGSLKDLAGTALDKGVNAASSAISSTDAGGAQTERLDAAH